MYVDSIVDEAHQIRQAILAEYGGDMKVSNKGNTKFTFRIPSEGDAPM